MTLLILEAIGPRGEELAMAVSESHGFPVGWDSEFNSATFDVDGADQAELQDLIFTALDARDPDWRSQLHLVE